MWLVQILYFVGLLTVFLLLGYCGESVNGDFYGNASARLLRFRDFEPRQPGDFHLGEAFAEERDSGVGRQGRGFHFQASDEDVSVELEFIVPFVRVPVKRSMSLARDAVQNLLNLRTGTLLNTAVVVAAGAVIAAVVRLLLAPLVVTSLGNGNGYSYKSDHTTRGMRSLTNVVESHLEEHNIDMSACVQRYICQYLQHNISSSYARLLHLLASSPWLESLTRGTAVVHAIQTAHSSGSRTCGSTYARCRLPTLGKPQNSSWTARTLPKVLHLPDKQQQQQRVGSGSQTKDKLSQPRSSQAAPSTQHPLHSTQAEPPHTITMGKKYDKWISNARQPRSRTELPAEAAETMKVLHILCALLANCALICAATEGEEPKGSASSDFRLPKQKPHSPHSPGFKLVSFDAVGKHISLGLDYLVPFLEVPIKRKRNAPPKPLVIINSAAVLSCGLVAAGGLLVGHLIRSMGLDAITQDDSPGHGPGPGPTTSGRPKSSEESPSSTSGGGAVLTNATARGLLDRDRGFLELFKLVYRNETGERVESSLPSMLSTVERTYFRNEVDLSACLLKSLCTLTFKASDNVRKQQASDMDHLLDAATNWSWILGWLEQSTLREAIEAGKDPRPHHCTSQYPHCQWAAPDERILQLLQHNVQFK
ncbi:uncharacterized protein LOC111069063 [Drosophila obscura]|uniref:uncharacterized protein LOC111069063 n=1 Tax=Drosophila obscura TaxID=7282 RepID=UPI001BB28476|nr:uncharacterized protein LOC111069063 [Drosophila obscura]